MADQETELLLQEISRLKNELQVIKDREKNSREDYEKKLLGARRDRSLTLLLAGFKTKFDDLPADVKDSALQEIVNNSLAADNAELAIGDAGQLILRRKDGSNFFGADHRLFTANTYLENLMTREKILKGAALEHVVETPTRVINNTGSRAERTISSLLDQSLQAFQEQNVF
jgi:hypothetical protein